MQSLATFFEDNKPLAYAATVAAIIVLIAVVYLLYRLLFGRRLRTARRWSGAAAPIGHRGRL